MSRGMTPVHLPCSCFLPPSSSSWILEAEESQQRKHRRSPGSRLNTDTTAAATLITALSPPYIVCHLLATHRTASLSSPSPFSPLCFAGKDHKISEIKWNGCLGMDMSLATWSGTWGNRRISCSFAEDCCCRALFFPNPHNLCRLLSRKNTHFSLLMSRTLAPDERIEWMNEPRAESNYGS